MNPWKVSAQFAAYLWFTKQKTDSRPDTHEARKFARDNWVAFLPYADQGVGKLLIAVNKTSRVGKIGRRKPAMVH